MIVIGGVEYRNLQEQVGKNKEDIASIYIRIPAVPSSTGTYVLKCIDGVYTWVIA